MNVSSKLFSDIHNVRFQEDMGRTIRIPMSRNPGTFLFGWGEIIRFIGTVCYCFYDGIASECLVE